MGPTEDLSAHALEDFSDAEISDSDEKVCRPSSANQLSQ